MIDEAKLRKQRLELAWYRIETLRIRAEYKRQEAANRLRAAELEAITLGLRIECPECHREMSKREASGSGKCGRCRRTAWEAAKRERTSRRACPGPSSAERAA